MINFTRLPHFSRETLKRLGSLGMKLNLWVVSPNRSENCLFFSFLFGFRSLMGWLERWYACMEPCQGLKRQPWSGFVPIVNFDAFMWPWQVYIYRVYAHFQSLLPLLLSMVTFTYTCRSKFVSSKFGGFQKFTKLKLPCYKAYMHMYLYLYAQSCTHSGKVSSVWHKSIDFCPWIVGLDWFIWISLTGAGQ